MTTTSARTWARGELSDNVLDFCRTLQRLVVQAKQHTELTDEFWAPLQEFVDVENYRRCSQDYATIVDVEAAAQEGYDNRAMKSNMLTWPEWTTMAGDWAMSSALWEYTVMRIAEFTIADLPPFVYLELEERGGFSGQADSIHWANTILLFEFNDSGKLTVLRLGVADYALRAWPVSHPSTEVAAAAAAAH